MDVDKNSGVSGIILPQIDENHDFIERTAKEKMVEMLDTIETHVERLRKVALQLEEDRDSLLASLDSVRHAETLTLIPDFDKEDILKYSERIENRCHSIEIHIHTTRDQTQMEALDKVNDLIDALIINLKLDPEGTKTRCLSYMNACSSHFVHGVMDKNFESALLGCTLDDQKRVKKHLQNLFKYFEKTDTDFLP